MADPSSKSSPTICVDMFNVIFSLASVDGAKLYASLPYLNRCSFGPAPVPASLSAPQVKEADSRTSAISGQRSSTSSASAALQSSLESKLRRRLEKAGSTLYKATWKAKATPAGRRYLAHTASAHRTKDRDSTGWQTPKAGDACESGATEKQQAGYPSLTREAQRAWLPASGSDCIGWATPQASDWVEGARTAVDSNQKCLGRDLNRSGWPSPVANDRYAAHGKDTPSGGFMGGLRDVVQKTHWPTPIARDSIYKQEYVTGTRMDSLTRCVAWLTPWATPQASDWVEGARTAADSNQKCLGRDLNRSGAIASGSPAATEKPGQLNPELSRWLMGYPPAWSSCADTATR